MNVRKLNIAVIQMDCKIKDKQENTERAVDFINQLDTATDIACLPEFFTTGYNLDIIGDDYFTLAETIPGPTTDSLCEKAKELKTSIIGSIVEKDPVKEAVLYDTAFIIDKEGSLAGKYRKYNLYPTEYKYFRPGDRIDVFDLCGVRIGLAICFDHAFPELFRIMTLLGAQIIFIPSAVPTGYDHLLNLRSRARAQDNQIFIIAANRTGKEGDISFCGLSKVVNPKGRVLVEAQESREQVIYSSIDVHEITEERKQEPVLRCLRQELLCSLSQFGNS